jgi:hypothetical protein
MMRMRWLIGYNLEAALSVRLAGFARAVHAVRAASSTLAISVYVFAGLVWEEAEKAMRGSFAPVPLPLDGRLRASIGRWIVSAQLLSACQRLVAPPDERHVQMVLLLARLRPLLLFTVAYHRDYRHARILVSEAEMPRAAAPSSAASTIASATAIRDAAASSVTAASATTAAASELLPALWSAGRSTLTLGRALSLCRRCHMLAQSCRLARSLALAFHMAAPERFAARAGAQPFRVSPLLLRMLDATIVVADLVGVAMHLRIELAGLRGLLALLSFANTCGPRLLKRVRPHESGLWSRRYCEIEERQPIRMTQLQQTPWEMGSGGQLVRRGLRWDLAVLELRVPLRALYAFWGERGLIARGFPPWAVRDVRAIDLLGPGPLPIDPLGGPPPAS